MITYAIPSSHPAAKGGNVYCVPSFIYAPHMCEDFAFIVVDTQKIIAELQTSNQSLLKHAEYKFNGTTPSEWLKFNSADQPLDMGQWIYGVCPLTMSSGQAGLIALADKINLPCFPLALEKAIGPRLLADFRQKFEYIGGDYRSIGPRQNYDATYKPGA